MIATIVLSFVFEAWTTNWAMTMIGAISIVLFVETFAIYFNKHPKAWRTAQWVLLVILLSLFFLS